MNAPSPPIRLMPGLDPPPQLFGDAARARGTARGWDLLGSVPVPLRQRVRDGLADLIAGDPALRPLRCCVPMGQGGRGPLERLRYIRRLDDYPDMLVSAEYGNVFNRRFHAAHFEAGAFAACQPEGAAAVFSEAGLIDPAGWIGVFAAAPFVLLVDRHRLGDRPVPRRWGDLLEPDYRGEVVVSGWRRDAASRYSQFNLFLFLALVHDFGLAGLARLLGNLAGLMHTMQMPRLAGTDASRGAVYVLPWALADLCPRRDATEVVWPEDGALAFPLWLTVKARERRRLAPLVDHFYGTGLAAYLNQNRYPALSPGMRPLVPDGGRLKWPGWDFVRHRTTADLVKAAKSLAADLLEASPCG